MNDRLITIELGFGSRLRKERERLGFNQDAFATAVGIKRLAQSSYEKEQTSPNIRYLVEIGNLGVDLVFLLFGIQSPKNALPAESQQRIEKRIFHIVEEFAEQAFDGKLSADIRYMLFDLIRKRTIGLSEDEMDSQNFDLPGLLARVK